MKRGKFITFEGGECSGKTSIIERVCEVFDQLGIPYISTREPGGIDISEQIRKVILDVRNTAMTKETEALLYAASRMQHLSERILPALEAGKVVLCDRYIDSSLAYQGYARGLGIDDVLKINHFALKSLPDLTFFIDVKPKTALSRLNERAKLDRLDLETMKFHEDVYQGYLKLCGKYPDRIVMIDGNRPLEEITNDCIKRILTFIS
ncbi:MAG TPA: dTMP kinase [Candidatus Pelethenecus faecipullorum]|uniref:Thymidylate kinase n=1 Tax=Candidatus Pelethenecus faecipullorum TaxID=2840900 RepID=A0A9D1GR85_9MOLU|nr:dTMP kinase [Candidatus Pelethenecus faecipullorum]